MPLEQPGFRQLSPLDEFLHPTGLVGRTLRRFKRAAKQATPAVPCAQRVAQLLLKNPDLMILDDPFAGLPAAAALEMKDQIRAIARQGKTAIVSDRSLSFAKDVCDRMAIFFRGQIQALGSLDEILAVPDAIRVIGPVLPPGTAERVLTTIREEILGHSNFPEQNADDVDVLFKSPKPQVLLPDPETRESRILTALTQPSEMAATVGTCAEQVETVNHEKLVQLTKPGSATTNRS